MARQPYILVEANAGGNVLRVKGAEARHLQQTLRVKPGYAIIGFDGEGHGWEAEVAEIGRDEITCRVLRSLPPEPVDRVTLHVCVGIVKGARMDMAVEKAAEIGAASFTPLLTEWSVVNPGRSKLERWRNIALAAAKQSRRLTLMNVRDAVDLTGMISAGSWRGSCLVMYNSENAISLPEYVSTLKGINEITVMVGPEGGFSPDETLLFTQSGFPLVSLGRHPLRTETATAVALGMLVNLVQVK